MSARGLFLAGLVLLVALLAVPFFVRSARAQAYPPPPPPPPCQSIILPNGKLVMCCTSGTVTTCM